MQFEFDNSQIGQHEIDDFFDIKEVHDGACFFINIQMEHGNFDNTDAGCGNQTGNSRSETIENIIDNFTASKFFKELGNNSYNDDRRNNNTQCCCNAADDTGNIVADISGHIDTDWSGGGLGNGNHGCDQTSLFSLQGPVKMEWQPYRRQRQKYRF